MKISKNLVVLLPMIIGMILIILALSDYDEISTKNINSNEPTYKGDYSITLVYSSDGNLNYRLIAQHIEHFSDRGVSLLKQPTLTTYNNDTIQTWSVCSQHATLTADCILYLSGHVEIQSLTPDVRPYKITTDNVRINLITQDVISQDFVTLHGTMFNSRGFGLQGNLRAKRAKLLKKVQAAYEIRKQ